MQEVGELFLSLQTLLWGTTGAISQQQEETVLTAMVPDQGDLLRYPSQLRKRLICSLSSGSISTKEFNKTTKIQEILFQTVYSME